MPLPWQRELPAGQSIERSQQNFILSSAYTTVLLLLTTDDVLQQSLQYSRCDQREIDHWRRSKKIKVNLSQWQNRSVSGQTVSPTSTHFNRPKTRHSVRPSFPLHVLHFDRFDRFVALLRASVASTDAMNEA
jgi:hypothetical protein